MTGAVYSLDGSDSLKDTMQTSIAAAADKVTAVCLQCTVLIDHTVNVDIC